MKLLPYVLKLFTFHSSRLPHFEGHAYSLMKKRFPAKSILTLAFILTTALLALAVFRMIRSDNAKLLPHISSSRILKHLQYLASDELTGRMAGTPGAEKAAAYIEREFKTYALAQCKGTTNYLQPFSFVSKIELGKTNRFSIVKKDGRLEIPKEFRLQTDFVPAGYSLSGTFHGEAFFAGYGISAPDLGYDDYKDISVKDKIVFVLRYGPEGTDSHGKFGRYLPFRYKVLKARENGAKAIVFIDDLQENFKSMVQGLRLDVDLGDSGIAVLGITRQMAREIFREAGQDLDERQKEINLKKRTLAGPLNGLWVKLQCELHKKMQPTANVVGFLEGRDASLKDEVIIIGAHYDHIGLGDVSSLSEKAGEVVHNGADDNASGIAGLLELARVSDLRRKELKRSLLFVAFSAEEEGLLGSKYYVANPPFPLQKTVAMFNMDMIGRMKEKRLIIGGTGSSSSWRGLLNRLNQSTGLDLKYQDDGYGPSDHSSFYAKDVPVLFFFTGVHQDYHRPSDDVAKIDVLSESKILELIFETAKEVCDQENRLLFTKAKESHEPQARGEFRVYLGTIPEYGEEVEGVKLSGVREGSPASRAGLRGGDIIVECAGRQIKNVYDYTYVLQDRKVGETIDIVVIRDKQHVPLKATLEARP